MALVNQNIIFMTICHYPAQYGIFSRVHIANYIDGGATMFESNIVQPLTESTQRLEKFFSRSP
jgi:hypothetical protein